MKVKNDYKRKGIGELQREREKPCDGESTRV